MGYQLKTNIELTALLITDPINSIEVQPIVQLEGGFCEVCDPEQADFYSVFVHKTAGEVICIADCTDSKTACEFAALLETIIAASKPANEFLFCHVFSRIENNDEDKTVRLLKSVMPTKDLARELFDLVKAGKPYSYFSEGTPARYSRFAIALIPKKENFYADKFLLTNNKKKEREVLNEVDVLEIIENSLL